MRSIVPFLCIASAAVAVFGCTPPPPILRAKIAFSSGCSDLPGCQGTSVQIPLLANGEGTPPMRLSCSLNRTATGTTFFISAGTTVNGRIEDGFSVCGTVNSAMQTTAAASLYFATDAVLNQRVPTCSTQIVSMDGNNLTGRLKCTNVRDSNQRLRFFGGITGVTTLPDTAEFEFQNCIEFPVTCQ